MNGAIIIDKPQGMTSYKAVEKVKRILKLQKAGHTGTLDPLATGVLPVCVNEATKLVRFLAADDKEYRVTLLLGVRTDTFDTEGRILSNQTPSVSRPQLEEALKGFTGRFKQKAPLYSAVKVRGKALYRWTRQGVEITPPEREVEIYSIRIDRFHLPEVDFTVSCSKGTYVRTLCADIGDILGCGGCLSALRRTRSGIFGLDRAVTLEDLSKSEEEQTLFDKVIPLAELLPRLPMIEVDDALAKRIKNGYQPKEDAFDQSPFLVGGDMVKIITGKSQLVAVASMSRPLGWAGRESRPLKILRVFNNGY